MRRKWLDTWRQRQPTALRLLRSLKGNSTLVANVEQHLHETISDLGSEFSETQALYAVEEAADTSDVVRLGDGQSVVYAYGYRCAPDRLKVGLTTGDTVQRIVAQISTGTPDKPTLVLEIRSHDCSSLERALHAVLEYRGAKVVGAEGVVQNQSRRDHFDLSLNHCRGRLKFKRDATGVQCRLTDAALRLTYTSCR